MVNGGEDDLNHFGVGNYTFEQVQEFKYFDTTLNDQNNIHHGEINIKMSAGNRRIYA